MCYHILLKKTPGQGQKQKVQDPLHPKPDKSNLNNNLNNTSSLQEQQ
jgi:hypothetical protein